MASDEEQVRDLSRRWATAQERGDVDALAETLSDDFQLVGPLGFVLSKE